MSAGASTAAASAASLSPPQPAGAALFPFLEDPDDLPYSPARRPTAYRVDSTIPPTLLPISTVSAQAKVLDDLGRGRGTDKDAVAADAINLNNMLNKAVFGTAAALSDLASGGLGGGSSQSPASFVCLGVPGQPSAADVELAASLLRSVAREAARSRRQFAVGVAVFPYSAQPALDGYVRGAATLAQVQAALESAGVSAGTRELYRPVLELARDGGWDAIACGVETEDRQTVLGGGLQNVDPARRARYVADPEGFIATVSDPRFKLYTDRSLLKDAPAAGGGGAQASPGNFFAERILAHEAAATAVARRAVAAAAAQPRPSSSPGAIVAVLAPAADVRYLNGINGRIPRVYQKLAAMAAGSSEAAAAPNNAAVVTANDVTTILLNPTPADTLSRTRRLRLEIGTGPETLPYQTKVADYLWFGASPSVSLLPRLMDG